MNTGHLPFGIWREEKADLKNIPEETQEQVSYLYATALATYKFVYENSETQKNYSRSKDSWSHGVDKDKIFKILNVNGRKKQRERIYNMRDALGTFLKSKLYQNSLLAYSDNIPVRQETGKLHVAEHLLTLVTYEGMADRDLNLTKDYKPKEDYWIKLVRANLLANGKSLDVIKRLFDLRLDIEEVENVPGKTLKTHLKFGKKFLSIGKKVTGIYAAISPKDESEFKIYLKHFSYLIVKTKGGMEGPFYKLKNKTFKQFLSSSRLKELTNNQNHFRTPTHTYLKVHPKVAEKAKKLANANKQLKDPLIYIDKADQAKFGEKAKKFINTKGFSSLVGVFELFSLGLAIYDVSNKNRGGFNFKNSSSLFAAGIKTGAITMKLTENSKAADWFDIKAKKHDLKVPKIIKQLKITDTKTVHVSYKGTAKVIGTAGGVITVIMSARDSYIAYAKADYDVAIAQAVAGVSSGLLLSAGLGFVKLSFTPAFIIGIIGLVALGVAYYFIDTELEAYFKHYPLSTFKSISIKSSFYDLEPYEFMVKLYAHKADLSWPDRDNLLVQRSSENFQDFKQIFVDLMNIIAVCSIEIKGSESLHSPRDPETVIYQTPKPYRDKWYHPWRSMGININFGAFLRDVDDLEYEVYYIHYDPIHQKGYSIPIPKRKLKVIPFTVPNTKLLMVQLWLQTPETLNIVEKSAPQTIMNVKTKRQLVPLDMEHGEIAALCKINNVHEQGFPLTKNYKQGYLYAQLPIQYRDVTGRVTKRSGFTQVITKQQFLNTYPLKRIPHE